MNKKIRVLATLLGACSLMALTNCTTLTPKTFEKYKSVANVQSDASFTFEDASLRQNEFLYPESKNGKTYYVSVNGNNTASGLTESEPITMDKVSSLELSAGDQVLFRKGDKFQGQLYIGNRFGDDDNPITIASYGESDKKPIIENSGNVIVFEKCSNLVIRDLEVSVKWKDRGSTSESVNGIIGKYDYVGNAKYKNIYIVGNTVYSTGTRANVMGITISSVEKTFDKCPSDVITNAHVKNNLVYNVGRSGIHAHGWLAEEKINQNNGLHTLFRNFYFDNNVVHDVGCIGLYLGCVTNSTMNRNLIYNTGMYDVAEIMEGECGIMAISLDTSEIKYNISYNNFDQKLGYDAMAIDIDWNTKNCIVQYNYAYNCMGGGIGTMANVDCAILNNRVENNQTNTNQYGQISVGDFTSRYAAVKDDMHVVRNLRVEENLIIASPSDYKGMFYIKKSNGDDNWSGNSYVGNHVVCLGDNKDFYYNYVDEAIPWYKFANNKYYGKNLSFFRSFDTTDYAYINYSDGAEPYEFNGKFESWKVRDLGSTYEQYDSDLAPSKPTEPKIAYKDGKINCSWKGSKGDLWHYNIFCVNDNEDVSYTKMLLETKETKFETQITHKGEYYFIIQPESNQGVLGQASKIKVVIN